MEVQELIFAVHPGMTDHLRTYTFGENYRYLCYKYKIMPYIFRSDFPFIITQMHLYVDDHHGPHREAVMVRELCIAIDENRFTVFTAEEMCHLVEYLCTI